MTAELQRHSSGALINTDSSAYIAAKRRRDLMIANQNRINILEQELSDIKIMLSQLIEQKKNV